MRWTYPPTEDRANHQQWWRTLLHRVGRDQAVRVAPPPRPAFPGATTDRDPANLFATTWPTRRAALLSARANREAFGHDTWVCRDPNTPGWWVSVADITRELERAQSRARADRAGRKAVAANGSTPAVP